MPRGSTVGQVRLMVKTEIGDSVVSGVNAQTDGLINRRIVQMQQWLANEFKWPFLYGPFDAPVATGQRFVTFPVIVLDNSVKVNVKYNLLWSPVGYGVGPAQYNIYDSERNIYADPITFWREYNGAPPSSSAPATMQIEVWPIPRTPQTLRLEGQRALQTTATSTITDASILDLDDIMLAFFVGAQQTVGTPLGQMLQAKAQARFNELRAQSVSEHPVFPLGTGIKPTLQRETTVVIAKPV